MQMRVEISNLHADLGNTMIYVTHDQIEAMTMADRIVVLRDGLVAQVGRPLDLYNQPANKFVAGFIGSPRMNFLDGQITTASETMLSLDCGHSLAIHPTKPQIDRSVSVGIRPEDIEVSTDGTEDITVRVNNFEQLGSMTYIYTQLANGENLTVQLPHQVPLERNQELPISFPSSSIHVFGNDDEKAVELEA
jgi:ABC-type sugar transport system ATPase subunit